MSNGDSLLASVKASGVPVAGKTDTPSSMDVLLAFVAQRIHSLRIKTGLSQLQLAERASCGENLIFLFENARSRPTLVSLHAIATALDVEVADLLPPPRLGNSSAEGPSLHSGVRRQIATARDALTLAEDLINKSARS